MDIWNIANITVVNRALRLSLQHTGLCVEDWKGGTGPGQKHYCGSSTFNILRKSHTFWSGGSYPNLHPHQKRSVLFLPTFADTYHVLPFWWW